MTPRFRFLGVLLFWFSCSAVSGADLGYVQVTALEFASETDAGLAPIEGWEPSTLPHRWNEQKLWERSRIGWYRIKLSPVLQSIRAAENPDKPVVVYLQRLSTNAQAWVNDEFIGSGGSFAEPVARNMHRPLLFNIPRSALNQEDNFLYIRLKVYPTFAHLIGVRVGFDEVLRPTYDGQYFLQVTMSQVLFIVAFICGVFAFLFWVFVERRSINLFYSLTAFSWSIYCLNLTIRDIPISADIWWAMIHVNLEWAALLFILFIHRMTAVERPVFERTLIVFASIATVGYAFAGIENIKLVSQLIHSVTLALFIYMAGWLVWQTTSHRSREAGLLTFCVVCLIVMGANDLVRHTVPVDSPDWQTKFYTMQFGAPLMFIIIAVYLGSRYTKIIRQSAELEIQQLATRHNERQRIYQDLHDDVGAKLLGLVYAAQSDEEAELARGALADIRQIVAERSLEAKTLPDVVNDLFSEIRYRASNGGLDVKLTEEVETSIELSGETIYHLSRIFRELLSNTLKHANASKVSVNMVEKESKLTVSYHDNGTGMPSGAVKGSGLTGMERRVQAIGATINYNMENRKGFWCSLTLPLPSSGQSGEAI